LSYKGDADDDGISIQCTMNIEHTYVMKDGKVFVRVERPSQSAAQQERADREKESERVIEQENGRMVIRYNL
jgi:hypothetical protein